VGLGSRWIPLAHVAPNEAEYHRAVTFDRERPTRGRKQVAVLAAFVVGGVLVWGLGTELTLRATGRVPHEFKPSPNFGAEGVFMLDPVTGWVNKPGRYRSFEPGRAWLTITETGLRGTGLPAPSAATEVLIVGASCTQGYGVEDRETFTHGLSRNFPDLAFSNLASGGYNSVQSHIAMNRYLDGLGAQSPPALVIYGFVGRVAGWNVATASWVRQVINETGEFIVPPHVEAVGDEWVPRPGGVVPRWPLESRSALVTMLHEAWISHRYDASPEDEVNATLAVLTEMALDASVKGSKLLVVLLTEDQPNVMAELKARGLEVLDCRLPNYETVPKLKVGFHPSRVTHAAWTRCIGRWLRENRERL
jgi:hypothetical protein